MEVVISLLFLIIICAIFVLLAKKIKVPEVIALILAGLFISIPIIKNNLIGNSLDVVILLGDIGLFSLMYLAGLETSWKELYKEKKDSFILAFVTAVVSFLLGFLGMLAFGFPVIVSFIVGIAMSITAEATRAKVLLDLKVLKTRVGAALMGAGIVDDLFGLCIFVAIMLLLKAGTLYNNVLLVGSIVCFFGGILSHQIFGRWSKSIKFVEKSLTWIIVPFFFIAIGLNFNFTEIIFNPLLLSLVLILGFSGKFVGAFVSKKFLSFNWKQLYLISWAMNSRGAIELALALIAFKVALIPQDVYSSLVVLALISTGVFPFIITRMIKKSKRIMN